MFNRESIYIIMYYSAYVIFFPLTFSAGVLSDSYNALRRWRVILKYLPEHFD